MNAGTNDAVTISSRGRVERWYDFIEGETENAFRDLRDAIYSNKKEFERRDKVKR